MAEIKIRPQSKSGFFHIQGIDLLSSFGVRTLAQF